MLRGRKIRSNILRLTVRFPALWCFALGHLTLLLQINVPAFCLPLLVLECEREYCVAFLYKVLTLRRVRLEGAVDGVEGHGRGKCAWILQIRNKI